ncbi:MAG: hypothetical protein EXR79_14865 [Myxococcales bacterium]|nr:hypothetical protein [Myxococcales bacterium]
MHDRPTLPPAGLPAGWYDLSPLISERTAVFPGDTRYRRTVAMAFGSGDNLDLSSIAATLHLGAHCDAPNHYHPDGVGIDQRDLTRYFGAAQVVRVAVGHDARIRPDDVLVAVTAPRVLFHTGTYPDPDRWNGDFAALSAELIDWLADQGVTLVGIDTPSIDPADDRELQAHHAVYRRDLAILEGIVLEGVPDGRYTLVALPLKLEGADASPVRALLVPDVGVR